MLKDDERRWADFLWWLGWAHFAGGLLLPFLAIGTPFVQDLLGITTAEVFWVAILGPTIASWGALSLFLVHFGIRRRERWACDALIVGVLAWAPLDALLCLTRGLWLGVAVDTLMVPLILAPAFVLRRRFL